MHPACLDFPHALIDRRSTAVADDDWVREDLVARSPYVLLGSVDTMIEALIERRERWGLSYIVCFESDLEAFVPLVRKLA